MRHRVTCSESRGDLSCWLFAGGAAHSRLRLRHGRAAGKLLYECVSDVAEVFDTDFAGEETVGGELAQESEELDALPQAGIFLRILAVGDQVENLCLLLRCAIEIRAAVAVDAGIVEPHQ